MLVKFDCLVSFAFPFYSDKSNTMIVCVRNGEKLLKVQREYLYQLLANEKGISHWKVSVGYGLFQTVVGVSVLGVRPLGLVPVILLLLAYSLGFSVFGSFVRRSVARPS